MKSTGIDGTLQPTGCYLQILSTKVPLNILPEMTDGKSSAYNDEPIPGRSYPVKSYSHGENRAITITIYFYADTQQNLKNNITYCRAIQSAVYPRSTDNATSLPFMPPPICQFYCSGLISSDPLCVVVKRYNLKIPRDVQWDNSTMVPYYFTMDLELDVVYNNSNLPGQERILGSLPNTSSSSGTSSNSSSSGPASPPPGGSDGGLPPGPPLTGGI